MSPKGKIKMKAERMKLDDAKSGTTLEIVNINDDGIKAQLIRLGITEGSRVKCAQRLPGGTIVISKNHQEVAIGSKLAKKIIVKKISK